MRAAFSALVFCLLCFSSMAFAQKNSAFAGVWLTTYGAMTLHAQGNSVTGQYMLNGRVCKIEGSLAGNRLKFKYSEPNTSGEGWFELSPDGQEFSGSWKEINSQFWMPWIGKRLSESKPTFSGVWETSFGRMRLLETAKNQIEGIYAYSGFSTINGTLSGNKLTFKYKEDGQSGEGWFQLSADGKDFAGEWRNDNQTTWQKWVGKKLPPIPGRVWLVVLEAHWEHQLEDKEYAFGDMLKAFFDRTPNVEVRRRTFTDATSLKRWLEEVTLFPEPTVVSIASHGESNGLRVDSKIIPASIISEGLRLAENLKALHFSSCLVMKKNFGKEVFDGLVKQGLKTSVSGYTNSVDWAASALFEMTFFDLLLSRGFNSKDSAQMALKLFPIAGNAVMQHIPIEPGGFKLIQ